MPTALSYVRALAQETGEYDDGLTTSAGAADSLVCSRFVNTALDATRFAGMHFLIEGGACAGQVGHVRGGGLDRSTGTITFANDLTTVVGSGVAWSSYRLLSPTKFDAEPAFLDIVNQSLPRLRVERTISFAGVTGQIFYTVDTTAYPWFTDTDRIMWVEYPTTQAQEKPRRMPTNDWDWDTDGETRRLVFHGAPFQTGQTFTVKVYAPGNSRLRLNATAYATLSTTTVGSVSVLTGGYYTSTPTVTLTGGGGSGATATATVTNNTVTAINVTAPGTGYTSAPTVTISAGAWADQTDQRAGLLAMSDSALPDVADMLTMGKARMYEMLSNLQAPSAVVTEWLAKKRPSIMAARNLQQLGPGEDRTTGVASLRPTVSYQRGYR